MELFKRNSKVFGIPLSEVFQNEFGIPRILVETISVLEQDLKNPLLFIPAQNLTKVKTIKAIYDKEGTVDSGLLNEVSVTGTILKTFLEKLPEPLLTNDLSDSFIACADLQDTGEQTHRLRLLISGLPSINKRVLEYLLIFFSKVTDNADKNGIAPADLGSIFGPYFLRIEKRDANRISKVSRLTAILIANYGRFFTKIELNNSTNMNPTAETDWSWGRRTYFKDESADKRVRQSSKSISELYSHKQGYVNISSDLKNCNDVTNISQTLKKHNPLSRTKAQKLIVFKKPEQNSVNKPWFMRSNEAQHSSEEEESEESGTKTETPSKLENKEETEKSNVQISSLSQEIKNLNSIEANKTVEPIVVEKPLNKKEESQNEEKLKTPTNQESGKNKKSKKMEIFSSIEEGTVGKSCFQCEERSILYLCEQCNLKICRKCMLALHKNNMHSGITPIIVKQPDNELFKLIEEGNAVGVMSFLKKNPSMNLNLVNSKGQSALYCACEKKSSDIITLLLQHEADPSIPEELGFTPLHIATFVGSVEAIMLLIQGGAQVNTFNKSLVSPLHISVKRDFLDVTKVLVKYGANLTCIDNRGKKPIDYAKSPSMIQFLKEMEALSSSARDLVISKELELYVNSKTTANKDEETSALIRDDSFFNSSASSQVSSYFQPIESSTETLELKRDTPSPLMSKKILSICSPSPIKKVQDQSSPLASSSTLNTLRDAADFMDDLLPVGLTRRRSTSLAVSPKKESKNTPSPQFIHSTNFHEVWIRIKNETIIGLMTLPNEPSFSPPFPVILLFHGFMSQKNEIPICGGEGFYVKIANELAQVGFASLRIDFRGSGASDGLFEDISITSQLEDAMIALEFLFTDESCIQKLDLNNVSILGNCLGGLVSILAAVKSQKICNLVLLNPIINPGDTFSRWFTPKIIENGLAQSKTFLPFESSKCLKKQFFDELYNFDPVAEISQFSGNLLIFTSLQDEYIFPSPHTAKLLMKYHTSPIKRVTQQLITLETNHYLRANETSLFIHKVLSSTIDFLLANQRKTISEKKFVSPSKKENYNQWDNLLQELEKVEKNSDDQKSK